MRVDLSALATRWIPKLGSASVGSSGNGSTSVMPPFEAPVSASTSDASISRGGATRSASSHLRPEDAFLAYSPPYRSTSKSGASENRRKRDNHGSRSASRRRPRTWKKLLWVKQACMLRTEARTKSLPCQHCLQIPTTIPMKKPS